LRIFFLFNGDKSKSLAEQSTQKNISIGLDGLVSGVALQGLCKMNVKGFSNKHGGIRIICGFCKGIESLPQTIIC